MNRKKFRATFASGLPSVSLNLNPEEVDTVLFNRDISKLDRDFITESFKKSKNGINVHFDKKAKEMKIAENL